MPADQRTRLKQWLDSGEAQLHPLTLPQRELWEVSPVPVEDSANHICCLIDVQGLLTERECRAAIQLVVDRRGSFASLGPSRPRAAAADDPQEVAGSILIFAKLRRERGRKLSKNWRRKFFARHSTSCRGRSIAWWICAARRTTTCWSSPFITPLPTVGVWESSWRNSSPPTSRLSRDHPRLCRRYRKPMRRGARSSALSGNRKSGTAHRVLENQVSRFKSDVERADHTRAAQAMALRNSCVSD